MAQTQKNIKMELKLQLKKVARSTLVMKGQTKCASLGRTT
jgi:hypothetical protein